MPRFVNGYQVTHNRGGRSAQVQRFFLMKINLSHGFGEITSGENLLEAWNEFVKGKRGKADVQEFSFRLSDNIIELKNELVNGTYRHGGYKAFNISDPKPRNIHKATVRDRLVHHAIYRVLYPFFERIFIADSYSCRVGKGTHKALDRFHSFADKASHNNSRTLWVLKGDIRKFFASIDHETLIGVLGKYISDQKIISLLREIIRSFSTSPGVGLPLGNLTSQLLVNIYMNEFDQFVKRDLKIKYYIRYADDFVILSPGREYIFSLIPKLKEFLVERLKLELHPRKLYVKTLTSGVDFLGWVNFPHHRTLRTATKRRMYKRLIQSQSRETVASYLGLLSHGDTYRLRQDIFGNSDNF